MASSPTAIGRVELQETGSNLNVWGDENNEVIKRLTEMGVGFKTISLTGDYTPTTTNYDANESRWGCIEFTDGGLSSQPTVTLPAETRYWLVINSGSTYAVACKASGSAVAAVTVEASSWAWIYCDGTDMFVRDLSSISGSLPLASVDGGDDITTVAGIAADVTAVAAVDTEVTAVAGIDSDVTTVAGISANVTTVAAVDTEVTTVAGISANVTTVAGDSADIQALAAITADISAAAAIDTDITAVAADAADIGTVSTNIASVNSVAGNATNINAVAGNATNINAVATDASDIGTVSTNIASVNTCATNIADIQDAANLIDGLTAADIANVAAGSIAATDVQAALNELDGEKVAGPASATDSAVAQFDGTTGKLLKNGLSVGTSANQLVQLDGSARLPAVDGSALTGISSVMDLINETTVSSPVASVAWTGLDTSTYETFMVQVIGASHNDAGGQYFYMQFSPDSGSTWRTTGYQGQTMVYQGPSTTAISQAVLLSFYQDSSASFLNAELTVHNLGNSSIRTLAMGQSISEYVTVGAIRGASIGAGYDTAEAHDSIRIIPQGGSLDAGTYRIFGVK